MFSATGEKVVGNCFGPSDGILLVFRTLDRRFLITHSRRKSLEFVTLEQSPRGPHQV